VIAELSHFLLDIDTAFLATASADGQPYVQHRGGPKGFIRVVDENTLGFVDMVGNRQYLSRGNLRENERVLLFLIDYQQRRRVKVWGTARAVPLTAALLETLKVPGQRGKPDHALLVTVTRWDANCPAHIPQKLDAREVANVIESLETRIADLEAENARLRARVCA
jgi:predicted pyridoxine 5'-phosphate oxidase superfamily flavin-nucleotide-binding protein